MKQDHSSKR